VPPATLAHWNIETWLAENVSGVPKPLWVSWLNRTVTGVQAAEAVKLTPKLSPSVTAGMAIWNQ
jgi:hypothetical protein